MADDHAPLSALITAWMAAPGDDDAYQRFLDAFVRAEVGVVVSGVPEGTVGRYKVTDGGVGVGSVVTPDGRSMVRVCADFPAFMRRFGGPFNAQMDGPSVLRTALANPACEGILVNSAASFHSAAIGRSVIEELVKKGEGAQGAAARKPWWNSGR